MCLLGNDEAFTNEGCNNEDSVPDNNEDSVPDNNEDSVAASSWITSCR